MITHDFALMADNAHIDASGKLYILGEFRYIFAPKFPARHGRMSIVSRWVAEAVDVRDNAPTLAIEVVDADGKTVMPRSPQVPMKFAAIGPAERGKVQSQVILQLEGILVPQEGTYTLHFFVNGAANGSVRFHAAPAPKRPPANAD